MNVTSLQSWTDGWNLPWQHGYVHVKLTARACEEQNFFCPTSLFSEQLSKENQFRDKRSRTTSRGRGKFYEEGPPEPPWQPPSAGHRCHDRHSRAEERAGPGQAGPLAAPRPATADWHGQGRGTRGGPTRRCLGAGRCRPNRQKPPRGRPRRSPPSRRRPPPPLPGRAPGLPRPALPGEAAVAVAAALADGQHGGVGRAAEEQLPHGVAPPRPQPPALAGADEPLQAARLRRRLRAHPAAGKGRGAGTGLRRAPLPARVRRHRAPRKAAAGARRVLARCGAPKGRCRLPLPAEPRGERLLRAAGD